MKKIGRLILLMALFCVDVRVRADDLKDCWGKSIPCPVQALTGKRLVEVDNLKISMSANALLEQRSDDLIQLVRGDFYVETAKPVKLQTPYGRFWCEGECKALFERDEREITIKNLQGRWLIQRTGETQTYALAPALQTWLGEVEPDGRAQMEFPQSLPWLQTTKLWAALYPGDVGHLKTDLAQFRVVWHHAVESVSELHKTTAQREIASYRRTQDEERARQKAQEKEDESLRNLFRQKNYLSP
jgi:hypothetical protein